MLPVSYSRFLAPRQAPDGKAHDGAPPVEPAVAVDAESVLVQMATLSSRLKAGRGEDFMLELLASPDPAAFLQQRANQLALPADASGTLVVECQDLLANLAALSRQATQGDAAAIEAVLELSQSTAFPMLGQFMKERLLRMYWDSSQADAAVRAQIAEVLTRFVLDRLPVRDDGSPYEWSLLSSPDLVYLAGAIDCSSQSQMLAARCKAWLCMQDGLHGQAKEAPNALLGKGRCVTDDEMVASLLTTSRHTGRFAFSGRTADVALPPTPLSLTHEDLEASLRGLAERATPARPVVSCVQGDNHWVAVIAHRAHEDDVARFIVVDTNAIDPSDCVGAEVLARIQVAGFGATPVFRSLQELRAPNGCGPLCVEAIRHAFTSAPRSATPLTYEQLAQSLEGFARVIGEMPQAELDGYMQVARARMMQAMQTQAAFEADPVEAV